MLYSMILFQDVAACTFMATATTMPEFFNNTISTFVADSDMGYGDKKTIIIDS